MTCGVIVLAEGLRAAPAPAPEPPPQPSSNLGQAGFRNYEPVASYDLEAELDPELHRVQGYGRVVWRNTGHRPVRSLWWHLYLNAFLNNRSTFLKESKDGVRPHRATTDSYGFIEILSLRGRPAGGAAIEDSSRSEFVDLMPFRTFEHPDDDNDQDRTVMRTDLPFSIPPGEEVELELAFESQLPHVVARSGYHGSFHMVSQWFPKLCVLEDSYRRVEDPRFGALDRFHEPRWNCHQYHATSEFFSDYGRYRAALTVPEAWVVGATGVLQRVRKAQSGFLTYEFEIDAVHDFAWTADRRFQRQERTFDAEQEVSSDELHEVSRLLGLPPEDLELTDVQVILLVQPEHSTYADRYFRAAFAAIKWFGLWYGAYPYPVLTIVDGPRGAGEAMGMEYPTLIAGGVTWPSPDPNGPPVGVTVHEFGHQYWYGLVGTNEFEEAWLDEGFDTYSSGKVMDRVFRPRRSVPRLGGVPLTPWFRHWQPTDSDLFKVGTRWMPDRDAVLRVSWNYESTRSYAVNSYLRAALTLLQLEELLGPSVMAQAMRRYHQEFRFRHPTSEDFMATVQQVSGRDLSNFFEESLRSVGRVDYGISRLSSISIPQLRGFAPAEGNQALPTPVSGRPGAPRYRAEVTVTRYGEAVHPLTLQVTFTDGSTTGRSWDGRYRWARFEFERDVEVQHAELYSQSLQMLDVSPVNDSRTREPSAIAAISWFERGLALVMMVSDLIGALL
ncbi:MAG: M1 family metallopeptidase [Myxococcota bacterium]